MNREREREGDDKEVNTHIDKQTNTQVGTGKIGRKKMTNFISNTLILVNKAPGVRERERERESL